MGNKRKKTNLALLEKNAGVAAALERVFAKERADISTIEEYGLDDITDAFAADLNNYQGALIGETQDMEETIRLLRKLGCEVPVVALIDHKNSALSIALLNAGADDVMVKPVNAGEVIERIHAVIRRAHGHPTTSIEIGEITAYLDGRDPEIRGERVKLSHREHTIFTQLALRVGRVVAKETIYDAVYGMRDTQPFDKVVDVYICKLRKKLASYTDGASYIETVYGRGYKLEAPEEITLVRPAPLQSEAVAANF
ncbi:cell cycle transcriptional regulator (CheY-like receiver domain) CtrA, putative [Tepidicaulis marinus]|jgi:two-component system cell cycle response regulator CtrA|uniref:Cell cycle response regulator CtrA n=2 Tax=Tepidicaulis marinus TaxID=1333998 RepID=A0A081BB31_9HYPH|nr:cell cycle transcriptional regulator (CheY-like receiver domain) CtrA, putative [Tepidicaulis marinus]